MNKQAGNDKDLNEGLDYVKDLPGYDRGHPHYFKDPMIDHLLEICLQLAGEIWVNRDRQIVVEHLLVTEGKVTPDMIESFKPDAEMKNELRDMRRTFTKRIFSSLYDEYENAGSPEFILGAAKDE